MNYDNALIAAKLRRWEKYLNHYRLPDWKSIPDIGLYMEQVAALLKDYLDYLPPELKEEQFLTPATVNNYVRKNIMPKPVKKKYYRLHIAYLIVICTLKHCLPIPTLQTILPNDLSLEEMESLYTSYATRHRLAAEYFVEHVREVGGGILAHENQSPMSTNSVPDLILSTAVISGFSRLLAEKLLLLNGKTLEDTPQDQL